MRRRTEFHSRGADVGAQRPAHRGRRGAGQREPGGPRVGGCPREAHPATPATSPADHPVQLIPLTAWVWAALMCLLLAAATCGEVEDPTGPPEGLPAEVPDAP